MRISLALALFAGTLILVLTRPRRIHEAWWATLGGCLALLSGLVHPHDVFEVVVISHEPLLFLGGLLLLSKLVEQSGFFEWAATHAARNAEGSGDTLFRNVFLLGAATTIALSLDTTALLLTPLVLACVRRLDLPARPYVLACAFVANAGSLLLPISNLTNLLLARHFGLDFARFALFMAAPQGVALAVTFFLLRRRFRGEVRPFDASRCGDPMHAVKSPSFFHTTWAVLAVTLATYFIAPSLHIPAYAVPFAACLVLGAWGAGTKQVHPRLLRDVSWGVFPFVLGLFVVTRGLENVGLAANAAKALGHVAESGWARVLVIAGGSTVLSNLANNLPAALFVRSVLSAGHPAPSDVSAALVGLDVGPNIFSFASLATILVLGIARQAKVEVTPADFVRAGLRVTPLALLAAAIAVIATTAVAARL